MNFTKAYLEIAHTKYKGLNLTGIQTEEEFHRKQFLDSTAPLRGSAFFKRAISEAATVVDVGFGGGFPLLPLAHEIPEKTFLGIDARRKKVEAVGDIAQALGMANVGVFHARLEEVYFEKGTVLLFKAVGKIKDCLKLIRAGGEVTCFFYKGPGFCAQEEIGGDGTVVCEDVLDVPDTHKRVIVGLTVGSRVKRDKRLVKMSDFH